MLSAQKVALSPTSSRMATIKCHCRAHLRFEQATDFRCVPDLVSDVARWSTEPSYGGAWPVQPSLWFPTQEPGPAGTQPR